MDYTKAIENYKQLHGHKAMQLRAVLFDMDGVLFDSMPYHADAWSRVMTDAGFNFSKEDVYMNEGRTLIHKHSGLVSCLYGSFNNLSVSVN